MTLANTILLARELSRTSVMKTDQIVMGWVNQALIQFSKDIHVQQKEAYLTVTPRFDIATNMAIRVTITGGVNALVATDVVICATSANDQTGTQVATALQTALRAAIGVGATITVTWSTTTWLFTVDAITSTAIVIAAPSAIIYDDATGLLGLAGSGTTSIAGTMPEDCTVEADLPSDFLSILSVEWDDVPLYDTEWPDSPEMFGTPSFYAIHDKKIRLDPCPLSQGEFYIRYKYYPTQFTDAVAQGDTDIGVKEEYSIAIAYYTAYLLALCNFEDKVAGNNLGNYRKVISDHIIQNANNNTRIESPESGRLNARIVF